MSLPAPPVKIGGRWYVPVEFIGRALSVISDVPLELRKASRLVLQGTIRAPRVVVRHDVGGNQARVTMDITPRTPHQVQQEATRAIVRFDADLIDLTIAPFQSQGIVQAIHPGEDAKTVAIDLGPEFRIAAGGGLADRARRHARDDRSLRSARSDRRASARRPDASRRRPRCRSPCSRPQACKTIVIDPGHGGDEAGAKGAKGTLEKAVTLSVARRLKAALEARLGARVLLTRVSDGAVGPDERAAVANNNKADLFISLHATRRCGKPRRVRRSSTSVSIGPRRGRRKSRNPKASRCRYSAAARARST